MKMRKSCRHFLQTLVTRASTIINTQTIEGRGMEGLECKREERRMNTYPRQIGHLRLWAKPCKPLRHTSPTCSTSRGNAVDMGAAAATTAAGKASPLSSFAATAVAGATVAAGGNGGGGGAPADKNRVGLTLLRCCPSSSSSMLRVCWWGCLGQTKIRVPAFILGANIF